MRTRSLLNILILIMGIFQTSCDGATSEALKALKGMKAKNYFESGIQVRFVEAVAKGNESRMRELIEQDADVNAVGKNEMRPLFWALAKQSLKGFEFLLENGADPNFYMEDIDDQPHQHRSSLMEFLAEADAQQYLKLALEHGGNPDLVVESYYPDGRLSSRNTIIFSAIVRNQTENVRILTEAGANLDYQNTEFSMQTPMMTAAGIKNFDIVYLLLEKGADPTLRNRWDMNLVDRIKKYGDRGMKKGGEQYRWYLKVIEELKRRGLWE